MAFPLIRFGAMDDIAAVRAGRLISAGELLGAAHAIAEGLPERRFVVNLCKDRYCFALGLLAALLRGQVSLLPPNDTPLMLRQLARAYPNAYALCDGPLNESPLPVTHIMPPDQPSPCAAVPAISASQHAVTLFTSGSTGEPKPIEKSWRTLVESTRNGSGQLGLARLPCAQLIGTVPPQHSYGLESTIMLALQHGLVMHARRPFYPADITAALAQAPRPRILVTSPIHLRILLQSGEAMPPVDLVICATAPLSAQLALEAERTFGGPLMEIYGCSEAGQIAVRRTTQTDVWQCFEGLSLHPTGERCHVRSAGAPDLVLLPDIIEQTGTSQFLLHGRTGDVVNIAGKRSSLSHLNFHLNAIAGVRDGVFIMPPGDECGVSRLMAFVVAPGLSADDILSELRLRIDPVFLPRPLRVVDILPRNTLGKLPHAEILRLVAAVDVH